MVKLVLGNCSTEIDKLIDEGIQVDAIVTDPPYGISFMDKKWDYNVPKVEVWEKCLKLLKPGGHALVACGTRTQHRMAVNLEDAGFEIRDIVAWVYGSGFPKSHNIGKAVDKLQDNDREVIGISDSKGICSGANNIVGDNYGKQEYPITKGSSPFEGWGTALKPAMELWTLCRKPLEEKTIAQNVLKYGTGGINIDESRIKINEQLGREQKEGPLPPKYGFNDNKMGNKFQEGNSQGRFPANLIHDGSDEVINIFPNTKSGKCPDGFKGKFKADVYVKYANNIINKETIYVDSGSVARFFYCAKASKSERNAGCENLPLGHKRRDDGQPYGMNTNKFRPDGSERKEVKPQSNNHPTVKPIKLMQYLIKLITPKGGTVLDPFMGSGSTGVACKILNIDFIGIELNKEYFEISKHRINSHVTFNDFFNKESK